MNVLKQTEFEKALTDVGVIEGQLLYTQTDLFSPGWIKDIKTKTEFCNFYLDQLFALISQKGSIVVPTYTTQVARFDTDFIWEETPTMLGLFPEFIRCHPNSVRSLHPLHSVSSIGPLKTDICTNNSNNDFGWGSPYHRMLELDAYILTIGLEKSFAVAMARPLEALCCLPYNYNKLLKWKPIVNGKYVSTTYFSNSRFLYLDTNHDLRHFADKANKNGLIRRIPYGNSSVMLTKMRDVFEFGVEYLKEYPYGFLEKAPQFKYGSIPFDGPTSGNDGINDRKQ